MTKYPESIKNAQFLKSLYSDQQYSSEEIGKQLGINGRLIRTWLTKFGIDIRSRTESLRLSAARRIMPTIRECVVCHIKFRIKPYRTRQAKIVYCSRECQIKNSAESLSKARRTYQATHPRAEKICPICHTAFTMPFSQRLRRKHCSDQCRGIAQIMANGARKTPTIPEQKIIEIVGKHFPDFKYNGNGELAVVLGGMIPDFINTNGKICKNWKSSELGKKMAYNSLGYGCLVLWEHEIKSKTDNELTDIIHKFSRRR